MPEVKHDEGDLEQYAGEEIPDPWSDEAQEDWPMTPGVPYAESSVEEEVGDGNSVGDDQERG